MMRGSLVVFTLCLAACGGMTDTSPASATSAAAAVVPGSGYFRVRADAPIAVRASPAAEAAVLSMLPPDAGPLEVVAMREAAGGHWGMIATGEGAGWVLLRGLEAVALEGVLGTSVPLAARCGGTEPFWGLSFEPGRALFHDPFAPGADPETGSADLVLAIESAGPADGRHQPIRLTFAAGRGHAILEQAYCSDGMSDIPYGWALQLLLTAPPEDAAPRFLAGCCRVWPAD